MDRYIIVALIGYLFGCLQWSYILTRIIKGKDIRSLGMGNPGASNTVAVFGWKMGAAVGILDILKAIISILLIRYIFRNLDMSAIYLNGFAVILGHNYPFFMGFKGGKGTASTVGMIYGIDYRLGLLGMLIVLVITVATDYIVLGTMGLVIFLIIATAYLEHGKLSLIFAVLIALQSAYKHRENFKRIVHGGEVSLRSTFKSKKKQSD